MRKLLFIFFLFSLSKSFAQENDIFERLSVLVDNKDNTWYNIDNYSVKDENTKYSFDEKGLKKAYKKFRISDTDIKTKDPNIKINHLFVTKQEKITANLYQTNNYYFIENSSKNIRVISFANNGKVDHSMEVELVNLIIDDKIPQENYFSMHTDSINFAGRQIELSKQCYWTFLNSVQCPYMGQMNWSIHKTLDDAKDAIETQYTITTNRNGAKITNEETVDVEFEGVPTKAKKILLSLTGVNSLLAGTTGGKSLTVYYVATNVRGKNVSCVMSFWNNDNINPNTQLPPLLEQVMVLK